MKNKDKPSGDECQKPLRPEAAIRRNESEDVKESPKNEDPITGQAGCHPLGTGVGTAIGAAGAAAIAGSLGGVAGTAVGAIVGGIAGGLAGKEVGKAVNPDNELAFWEENHRSRPYFQEGNPFEYYRPAYQFGWEAYDDRNGASWDDREDELRKKWEEVGRWENEGGAPAISWKEARLAAKEAYDRLHESRHGSSADSVSRKPR